MLFYPSENFLIPSNLHLYMRVNFNLLPFHPPLPQALNPGREMKLEDLEGLLLEIVELLDCRRECLIHVFSQLLNHGSHSNNY